MLDNERDRVKARLIEVYPDEDNNPLPWNLHWWINADRSFIICASYTDKRGKFHKITNYEIPKEGYGGLGLGQVEEINPAERDIMDITRRML